MNYLSEFLRNSGSQYPIQDGGEFRPDLAQEFARMKDAGWFDQGNGVDPNEQGNLQNALLGYPDQNSRMMQRQAAPQESPGQPPADLGGTVSTLNGWGAQAQKEKAALDAMFQGALAGGDIEKAARLAVTPQQQALLSVAYGQRANDQDRRARQESGLPVGPPTDLMKNYNDAQYTNVLRSQAEQDRQMKMAMIQAQLAHTNEQTAASQQARNTKEVPKPIYDSERGVFIMPPSGPSAGGVIPVSGLAPKDKPLTESQGKAAGIGTRAQAAHDILTDFENKGVTTPSIIKQGAEAVPLIGGGLGMAANKAGIASSDQQRVEQAQRDFVNAALRVESGASISNSEFDNARKQYFPQPGDSAETILQKQQNREREIQSLSIQAGKGGAKIDAVKSPSTTGPTFASLPNAASFKGRRMQGEDGIYLSDGTKWIKQ